MGIANAINANVDAFWNNQKSHEAFTAEQKRLWSAASQANIVADVSALLPVNQRN